MKVVLILIVLLTSHSVFAEKVTAERVLKALDLKDKNEIFNIIKEGHEQSNHLDGTTLILLSGLAFTVEDFQSAGVFHYQCMFRVDADIQIYPPKYKNRKNEIAKILVLIHKLNPVFNEYVFYHSDNLPKLIEPFSNWQPICDDSYDPGWIYEGEPDFKLCNKNFEDKIPDMVSVLQDRSKLLNHNEYNLLLMEIDGPSKNSDLSLDDVENIEIRMLAIEKELNIKGQITRKMDK